MLAISRGAPPRPRSCGEQVGDGVAGRACRPAARARPPAAEGQEETYRPVAGEVEIVPRSAAISTGAGHVAGIPIDGSPCGDLRSLPPQGASSARS